MGAPQAEPTTSDDGRGGDLDGSNGHTGRKERDHWSLLQKVLGLLTALLTLATAGLGLLAASAASEREDAQDEAAQLSNDLDVRTSDLEGAQAQITELEQQLADATSTPTTTDDPSGGSGDQEPGETPLSELDPVVDDNWDPQRDLDIDGTLHPQGIQSKALGYCGSGLYVEQQVEYSIGRQYSDLEAVAGLSEESLPGLPVKLEIFGDGRSLWSETLVVGSPKPVDLDVSGVLRLRVVTTKDFDDPGSGCNYVYAALGAPTLRP